MSDIGALFTRSFGETPTHQARAPGRVNLVGDHIDYHDLPVLPMALRRGVTIAFRPRSDGVVRLVNADPAYPPIEVRIEPSPPPGPPGDWGNYVRAAVAAVAGLPGGGSLGGFDACLDSDLPGAAGLSSSSALLVATATALSATHPDPATFEPEPEEWAALLARAEHYVGTQGGGMDQAASIGGRIGCVLRVSFAPVSWTARALPEEWALVVAHSGVRAEKSGAAQAAYNALRRSGTAALESLARDVGSAPDFWSLREAAPTAELVALAADRVARGDLPTLEHVLLEADRVETAWTALGAADATAFGTTMNESHTSLTTRCGVGHPRLDQLVEAAREAGATGARLTGAGFGGCIVALCDAGRADRVMSRLRSLNTEAGLDAVVAPVFRATPGQGARVAPFPGIR